ncbi:tetratricopeptide repeat protein, partial [bacterium]|nr:tetratricopeptide repeat protein [bacterium]
MSVVPPEGTLALVFTDIEGSSVLWERAPEAMREALALHDSLFRTLLDMHRGYEVSNEGDGFFVVFTTAKAALAWCLAVQEGLQSAAWPADLLAQEEAAETSKLRGLRVRMGVHLGSPDRHTGPAAGKADYRGPAVNRAARIARAAHGGQVLASGAVWEALGQDPGDAVATDLGEHGLRGLTAPERLVQFLPASLSSRAFPPIRAQDVVKTNLSPDQTSFVGRKENLEWLETMFAGGARLVTVLGPGGIGKTRLARCHGAGVVEEFSGEGGGVWFCDLSEARSIEGVLAAMGSTLNVPLSQGKTSEEATEQLGRAIRGRGSILLIMDNFETVADHASSTIGEWADAAPEARFLVTSRQRLGLKGEQVLDLAPLPVSDASTLFAERARAVRHDLSLEGEEAEVVEEIVRLVDGLPLAVELAAARVGLMAPRQILTRLGNRLKVLGGVKAGGGRQETMQGAIDWSWDLLSPAEQSAFAQCSVFRGGFFLEAAEEVIDISGHRDAPDILEVVQSLRDKSLLRSYEVENFPGQLRLGMYDTIREYAAAKRGEMEPAALASLEERHAIHYVRVGDELAGGLDGPWRPPSLDGLSLEQDNLLAVVRSQEDKAPARAAKAALACDLLLQARGPAQTRRALLDMAARAAARSQDRWLKARVLLALGSAAVTSGDAERADDLLGKGLAIARALGDWCLEGHILIRQGYVLHVYQGKEDKAGELWRRAVDAYRRSGCKAGESVALINVGVVASDEGEKEACFLKAHAVAMESGDRSKEGMTLAFLGDLRISQGRLAEAEEALERGRMANLGGWDPRAVADTCLVLADLRQSQGRHREAERLIKEALAICLDAGWRHHEGAAVGQLGSVYADQGRLEEAEERLNEAIAILGEPGSTAWILDRKAILAGVCQEQDRLEEAESLCHEALGSATDEAQRALNAKGRALMALAILRLERDLPQEAEALCRETLPLFQKTGKHLEEASVHAW